MFAVFTVTTTADSGPGSLRQAILDARPWPSVDEIRFNIPGPGVHTITPGSALPVLDAPLDATTQPGYAGSPLVELDGSVAGPSTDGLVIGDLGSGLVRGLAINGFGGNGIVVQTNARIEANYIGLNAAGDAARPNGGAGIIAHSYAFIGGSSSAQRNVISGNGLQGIRAESVPHASVTPLWVRGNFIGTDATGTVSIGNGQEGILVAVDKYPIAPTIGGGNPGEGNVISGNGASGIRLVDSDSARVDGNYIGVDATGARAMPNGVASSTYRDGVTVTGTSTSLRSRFFIGGATTGGRNVISGNVGSGISATGGNLIARGNFIGTDADGKAALGNRGDGITVISTQFLVSGNLMSGNGRDGMHVGSSDGPASGTLTGNYVGTDAAGTRSVGNGGDGVYVDDVTGLTISGSAVSAAAPPSVDPGGAGPSVISGNGTHGIRLRHASASAAGVRIFRNFIGTDVTGTKALGNGGSGVYATTEHLTIGGSQGMNDGNVISGNLSDGITVVRVTATSAPSVAIQGNRIGTDVLGSGAVGNARAGVGLLNSSGVVLGGNSNDSSFGNTIAYNAAAGVRVTDATAERNTISANSVFSNAGLGIDLDENGTTPNDLLDADVGPNGLQNFPAITAAATGRNARTETVVQFSLHAEPNTAHTVEFFASATRDASGYGEGATYLGFTTVTTDTAGNAAGRVTVDRAEAGAWLTATATSAAGNTSEFSQAVRVAERTAVGRRGSYEDGGGAVVAPAASVAPVMPARVTVGVVDSSGALPIGRRRGILV